MVPKIVVRYCYPEPAGAGLPHRTAQAACLFRGGQQSLNGRFRVANISVARGDRRDSMVDYKSANR